MKETVGYCAVVRVVSSGFRDTRRDIRYHRQQVIKVSC